MVSEARKQSMAWMETDYSKHTHFRWKIKWRLEPLGALGIMGEAALHLADTVSEALHHICQGVGITDAVYERMIEQFKGSSSLGGLTY